MTFLKTNYFGSFPGITLRVKQFGACPICCRTGLEEESKSAGLEFNGNLGARAKCCGIGLEEEIQNTERELRGNVGACLKFSGINLKAVGTRSLMVAKQIGAHAAACAYAQKPKAR